MKFNATLKGLDLERFRVSGASAGSLLDQFGSTQSSVCTTVVKVRE